MKKEINSTILIHASAEKIWQQLVDFNDYPNWNPFIKAVSGPVAVGNSIEIKLQQSPRKTIVFKPKVLVVNKNQELRWRGHLFFPGIFTGEHKFELIEQGSDATLFKHSETFTGILLPLLKYQLEQHSSKYFDAMNQALKNQVEQNLKAAADNLQWLDCINAFLRHGRR